MESINKLTLGILLLAVLSVPGLFNSVAYAQQSGVINCADGEFSTTQNCDLAIKKEVSVNGSAFADANISGNAVQGTVGDNVVWRITVTNPSVPDDGYYPTGDFIVGDNFPAGVTYVSSLADVGSYNNITNEWSLSLDSSTTYPVVLTINTTANSVGQSQNIAFLSGYACDGDFFCEYSDSNNSNDGDNAWINISAPPVVLGETVTATPQVLALADTGDALAQSAIAGALILLTIMVAAIGRFKSNTKADQ